MSKYKITICSNVEHLTSGVELPDEDRKEIALMAINKAVDCFCDDKIKIDKWLTAHSSEIDVEYEQSFQKWNGGYFYRMNEYREKGFGNGLAFGIIAIESDDSLETLPPTVINIMERMSHTLRTVMLTEEVRRGA